eukprot:m.107924 g.107924  ORF g.107924 m.107924 type:complete len:590 (-) comp27831_c0_seq1:53-1822(-)
MESGSLNFDVDRLGDANFENVPKMNTHNRALSNKRHNPRKWSWDPVSGWPVIDGLTTVDLTIGFRLFFVNKYNEALHFFEVYDDVPLCALAKGLVMFIWSLLTLEEPDLQNTIKYVKEVEAWIDEIIKSLQTGRSYNPLASEPVNTPEQLRYRLMSAECTLLISMMQLLLESTYEKIKGAMNIRSGWQQYRAITTQRARLVATGKDLDTEAKCSLNFGIGCFNMVASLLPPRVLALASFLGFPSDREFGLKQLELALNSGGLRSPVAGLMILTHHVTLQGACCHGGLIYEESADRVLARSLTLFPNGALFLMFKGRQSRMQKSFQQSTTEFELARGVQNWDPLLHFCAYELAFTHMFFADWVKASTYWDELYKENDWSKGFYAYSKGVCHLAAGDAESAHAVFKDIPLSLAKSKKINGRPLPMDRFVKRKFDTYIKDKHTINMVLPDLELIYVWNGFPQMEKSLLKTNLDKVTAWERNELKGSHSHRVDAQALVFLLKGALHSQLRNDKEAETYLEKVEVLKKKVKEEVWIIAYARYELAMLWYRMDTPKIERASKKMKHAMGKKGEFNFDLQLDLRGHLALYQFNKDD